MLETKAKWWAYKTEWGRIEGTKEALINSVKILDCDGKKIKKLKSGESLIIKVDFIVEERIKEPHFGVAIFREDGVYCYGPNTLFDGYKIDYLNKGKGWFSIRYKNIPLPPNNYRISVAIWDKKEILAYNYHSGLYKFKILGRNFNNQLFSTECRWDTKIQENLLNYDDILPLRVLKNIWKEKINYQNNIYIKEVEILDINDEPKSCFKTNKTLKLKIYLSGSNSGSYFLWIGIFREDGIYCHGRFKELDTNEKTLSLVYPNIPLLNGNYLISAGLFDIKRKKFLDCHHGLYPFKISSNLKDHGTIYCKHEWEWKLP